MLPEILASSYKRYKEDTNVFATWLSRAAEKCGYKPAPPSTPPSQPVVAPSTRLKGKARKDAKKAAGSTPGGATPEAVLPVVHRSVTTRDMIIQARLIASYKKADVVLPINIQRVLQRAIGARRRCLAWFQKTQEEEESNATHEHFIKVLEDALEILEPCCAVNDTAKAPTLGDVKVDVDPGINLSNRFDMLSVEDTNDDDLDVTVTDLIAVPKVSSKTKVQSTVYEVESDPDVDIPFAVYCFFEDMHRIQEFLKDTWRRYSAGDLDLISATLTTNFAFDLVRQAEENIIATYPNRFGKNNEEESQYEKIASVIRFVYRASYEGGTPKKGEVASAPFDDFVYMSTYHVISKFLLVRKDECIFPSEIPPLGVLYFWHDDLQQPTSDNWEGEDERLSQLLLDLAFMKEYAPHGFRGEADFKPAEDELTKGLQELINSGDHAAISVWVVFGASVLIDLWRILGENTGLAYNRLLEQGATIKEALRVKSEESMEVTSQGSCVVGPMQEKIVELWKTVFNVIEHNPKILLKARWLEQAKGVWGEEYFVPAPPSAEAAAKMLLGSMQAIVDWDMATLERRKQRDANTIEVDQPEKIELDFDEDELEASEIDPVPVIQAARTVSSSDLTIRQQIGSTDTAFNSAQNDSSMAPWEQKDDDTTFLLHEGNGWKPPTIEDIAEKVRKKGLKLKTIRPSPDPAYFYRNSPLYCGNESLRFAICMEDTGLNLANTYGSLFAVSQLYNAIQQNLPEVMDGRWNDLDEAIQASVDDFFSGQLPKTYKECWTRATIHLGMSAANFASNPRARQSSQQMVAGRSNKYYLKQPKTSAILSGYLKGEESIERCLIQVGEVYQTQKRAEETRNGSQSPVKKSTYAKRFLTPLEALAQLRDHMPQTLLKMEIGYVTLTKQCDVLLSRIRKTLKEKTSYFEEDETRAQFGKAKAKAAEMQIAENMNMVFNILKDAYTASERKMPPALLQLVANDIRDFLPEANKGLGEIEKWESVRGGWGEGSMGYEYAWQDLFLVPFARKRMQVSGLDNLDGGLMVQVGSMEEMESLDLEGAAKDLLKLMK